MIETQDAAASVARPKGHRLRSAAAKGLLLAVTLLICLTLLELAVAGVEPNGGLTIDFDGRPVEI